MVVAVSGGADSLALLQLLQALAPERGWTLAVAHLNHRQDPDIDDDAAAWLRDWAATSGLPFFYDEADLPPAAAEAPLRAVRYAFLAESARAWSASHVAVGHHADDQAETVLLRLLRGAVGGLAGMSESRPLDDREPVVTLVRPLLGCRKAELLDYVAAVGLSPILDPSNELRRFRRNWLRHEILPRVETQWPAAVEVLARTADWLGDDERYLQAEAARIAAELPPAPAPVPLAGVAGLPGPLRRRVMRQILRDRCGRAPEAAALMAVEAVLAGAQRVANLDRGWRLVRRGAVLHVEGTGQGEGGTATDMPVDWREAEDVRLPGWPYRISLRRSGPVRTADPWTFWLPESQAGPGWVWRGVRPGDRLSTAVGSQKVGELLRAAGVPVAARGRSLVLARGSRVAWAVGLKKGLPATSEASGWLIGVGKQALALDGDMAAFEGAGAAEIR